MKTYDNSGKLIGEINTIVRPDGGVVVTNTMYRDEHVIAQHISVRDNKGKVTTENVFGGKILP